MFTRNIDENADLTEIPYYTCITEGKHCFEHVNMCSLITISLINIYVFYNPICGRGFLLKLSMMT